MDELYTIPTTEVLLTVLVTTYKHSKYIAECLDSVVLQKTNFSYEVLIGVEEGDTETINICLNYQSKYPEILKVHINSKENVLMIEGGRTGRFNFLNVLSKARGKYIARCEGDDYWIDPYKLQKQVDFLEANEDYVFTFHNAKVKNEIKNNIADYNEFEWNRIDINRCVYDITDLIKSPLMPTASIVFRKPKNTGFPNWYYEVFSGDMVFALLICGDKKIKFFNEFWSVYRVHSGGITKSNSHKKESINSNRIFMYLRFNEHSEMKYENEILCMVFRHLQHIENMDHLSTNDREWVIFKINKSNFSNLYANIPEKIQKELYANKYNNAIYYYWYIILFSIISYWTKIHRKFKTLFTITI